MKTRKFIMIILSTMLSAGVAKAASEAPLKCEHEENIKCTVVSDNVEITNVILNRGRCAAPEAHTEEDIKALNEFRNKLEPMPRALFFSKNGQPTAFGANQVLLRIGALKRGGSADPDIEQYGEAYLRIALDPRGKYGFGDTVVIILVQSCNLIEFTIEANGQNWTWKKEVTD